MRKYNLKPPNCSTIHNKAGTKMSHLNSPCVKIMSLKAMLSWHFFIVFKSGSSHLEPFILTHSKLREATCRPFWKALWHAWRLLVDIFTKTFHSLSGKDDICSSNLFQTVLLTFETSLLRDHGILLSSRKDIFSAWNTPVAWTIKCFKNYIL